MKPSPKKPSSAKWFGWLIYAMGVIALGFLLLYGIVTGEEVSTIVIFFIVWSLLGGGLLSAKSLKHKIEALPERTAHAKVYGKTTKTSGGDYVAGYDGGGTGSYTTAITTAHFVSFDFDGRRENFEVDVSLYNMLKENETGTLVYKEHKNDLIFIDFKSSNHGCV